MKIGNEQLGLQPGDAGRAIEERLWACNINIKQGKIAVRAESLAKSSSEEMVTVSGKVEEASVHVRIRMEEEEQAWASVRGSASRSRNISGQNMEEALVAC